MRRTQWLVLAAMMFSSTGCSDEHSLPPEFHEDRIETPERLHATYQGEDVVLGWSIGTSEEVLYYIVTLAEGTTGAEWKYIAPGDQQTFTVEFTWTDSFYTFHVQAVDATDFVGESSNIDTVFIPQ